MPHRELRPRSSSRRRWRWLAVGIGTWALSGSVQAQPLGLQLRWDAPASCPSQDDVLQLIGTMAGGAEAEPTRADIVVRELEEGAWQADITLQDKSGTATRTLRGESCTAVAEATGIVLAIAVQRKKPAPPPPPTPPPAQPKAPEPRPTPVHESTPVFWSFGAAGTADFGTLPSMGLGVTALGAVDWMSVRGAVEGTWLAPRTAVTDSSSSQGADFSLLRLGLRGCRVFAPSDATAAAPCLLVGYERVTGDGFGSDIPRRSTSESFAFGAGATGTWRVTPTSALRLALDLSVPLRRPTFTIWGTGDVHRAEIVAFRITLGPALRF